MNLHTFKDSRHLIETTDAVSKNVLNEESQIFRLQRWYLLKPVQQLRHTQNLRFSHATAQHLHATHAGWLQISKCYQWFQVFGLPFKLQLSLATVFTSHRSPPVPQWDTVVAKTLRNWTATITITSFILGCFSLTSTMQHHPSGCIWFALAIEETNDAWQQLQLILK